MVEVLSGCGAALLPRVLEELNVSKNEMRRLLRHFREKCITQCQTTRFDVKVLGLSTTLVREAKNFVFVIVCNYASFFFHLLSTVDENTLITQINFNCIHF